jgi:hypothetical protein
LSQKIHAHEVPLHDGAAEQRAAEHGEAGDAAEDRHRSATAMRRNRGAQEREPQRHHERGTGALDGASGDQPADVGSERADGRRGREQRQPGAEQPPSTEAVAERRCSHHQHREAQQVGVDRPFELTDRRAQIAADRAQRGRDDQGVQRDHERRDGGQGEDPAW